MLFHVRVDDVADVFGNQTIGVLIFWENIWFHETRLDKQLRSVLDKIRVIYQTIEAFLFCLFNTPMVWTNIDARPKPFRALQQILKA
jgi:hypothetical protein